MQITSQAVEAIFMDCLFKEGEDKSHYEKAEGVMVTVGFHPGRLEGHKGEIRDLLAELPTEFREEGGGGWSFLNACVDKSGNQWGEHANIDQLLTLGIATGQAKFLMPREMWSVFPGGMPYFSVKV